MNSNIMQCSNSHLSANPKYYAVSSIPVLMNEYVVTIGNIKFFHYLQRCRT